MTIISSPHNQYVKLIKKLHHKKHRKTLELFLLEGWKLVQEALKDAISFEFICYSKSSAQSYAEAVPAFVPHYCIEDKLFEDLTTTEETVPILAVVREPQYSQDNIKVILGRSNRLILLEGIQDPGNLGTMIRTCCAGDVDAVLLMKGTTDLYNTKTVRSSCGNLWKRPVFYFDDLEYLKKLGYNIIITSQHAKKTCFDVQFQGKHAIVFGSEGHGISEAMYNSGDDYIAIPLYNGVESLNVSSSLSIIVYEMLRQRLKELGN